jgi:hypothetical protein
MGVFGKITGKCTTNELARWIPYDCQSDYIKRISYITRVERFKKYVKCKHLGNNVFRNFLIATWRITEVFRRSPLAIRPSIKFDLIAFTLSLTWRWMPTFFISQLACRAPAHTRTDALERTVSRVAVISASDPVLWRKAVAVTGAETLPPLPYMGIGREVSTERHF